jgi:predicted aspartyl protease
MKWKENTLLKVPFAVGNKFKTALIDTGAELSLISPSAVNYFELQVEPLEFPVNIQCANSETVRIDGMVSATVRVGEEIRNMDLMVVPTLPQDVIIGLDFIKDNGLQIIPGEQEIWFGGGRYPLQPEQCALRSWALSTPEETTLGPHEEAVVALRKPAGDYKGDLLCEETVA